MRCDIWQMAQAFLFFSLQVLLSFPIAFHISFSAHSSSWASAETTCGCALLWRALCKVIRERSKSFLQRFSSLLCLTAKHTEIIKREWMPLLQRGRQHSSPWYLNYLFLVVKPDVTCLCLFSELEPRPVCVPGRRGWLSEGVVLQQDWKPSNHSKNICRPHKFTPRCTGAFCGDCATPLLLSRALTIQGAFKNAGRGKGVFSPQYFKQKHPSYCHCWDFTKTPFSST